MSIFQARIPYKPFEYPEVMQFIEAINRTYWVHSEVDFTADIQDFHTQLTHHEKQTIKRSLLAIAQVEVSVKTFWGDLYKRFPKPEFNGLGSTFAENEFRHSEAYSRLLEVLGYSEAFEELMQIDVIQERTDYLSDALAHTQSGEKEKYIFSLILFSMLIENVSLFSQFAIILSFTRFRGVLKNVSNIIAWTSLDEQIHANAGIYIINTIRKEHPEYFTDEMKLKIYAMLQTAMEKEERILDWIFENGELSAFTKKNLLSFMHFRIDESLKALDLSPLYAVNDTDYAPMQWFDEEILANSLDDFFAKRPVEYTKYDKSITAEDLF